MTVPYTDRAEAGRQLAREMSAYADRPDAIVLGLPRGGVAVAYEVAEALGVPMDIMVVRKLGTPGQEELAMGAIATGGARVLNQQVIRGAGVPDELVEQATRREERELERRERAYRGDRPRPGLAGRCVILVDDGLATGATMWAAVEAARTGGAAEIVVAVPVGPGQTIRALRQSVDDVICPTVPEVFYAVGQWYADFPQVSDDEVCELLHEAWARQGEPQRTK